MHKYMAVMWRCVMVAAGMGLTLWGALALWWRLGWGTFALMIAVVLWLVAGAVCLYCVWHGQRVRGVVGIVVMAIVILSWWSGIKPSNDRDWMDEVAQMSVGRVEGEVLTMENVRDFDWRTEEDYSIDWQMRRYALDQLSSVDLFISQWGVPGIAHVMVSFGFEDGRFLTFSVETRKAKGQAYSAIGGFFREYALSIVAAEERDVIRVRTNIRHEDVTMYRLDLSPDVRRALLLSYVAHASQLSQSPRFYNTLTANCSTIVFDMMQHIMRGALPMDVRLLLTAYLPGYVAKEGGLMPGFSMETLARAGRINDRAVAAGDSADFSVKIREGVPGWR